MKVLLVNKFHYRKGGAETYYLAVGSELEKMGHEVAYFSMQHPDNISCDWSSYFVTQREYNDVSNPLKAIRDGAALVYSPEAKKRFQELCEAFCPDVVHLNNVHRQITLSILDAPYLGEHRVPVVYTAHDYVTICPAYTMLDGEGNVCDACLEEGKYRRCLERRCVKGSRAKSALAVAEAAFNRAHRSNDKINLVIAPSSFMRTKLVEGGWPEERVTVLQNFADDVLVSSASLPGEKPMDRMSPYLLFFGRLSHEKGVDTLLRAFDAAAPRLSDGLRLVVAGDGPERESLEAVAARLPVASRIEFVGYQSGERLRALVEGAAYAVCCSCWRENMPFSIVEAFVVGTPVIGTEIGGIPELVSEGETGFLCSPGNVDSLAAAIRRALGVLSDEDAYGRLGANCRAYVSERCSREKYINSLVDLYEGLVNG